ncbi:phosphate/phosphite/phosphonate ABC transporter substrate-binding protein [Roseovarius sp. Pro17]|uniref:phosphate/phosphite/phosphonate ABC transporter substrate-binding protein n=1 Tax=Roseovarius sp. Pro17 TaxID=3108175 RepID=UPI002D77D007|nr:PhnD/SsuA/transferrin family substrate-binding protein [Roseovarius sp. Pro17]
MIASLPMYDRAETADILDTLWAETRARLPKGAPDHLTRDGDLWGQWTHPDLILSQTCGYPYRTSLIGKVQLIAAPDNQLPDCPPGHYNSVFVVRDDESRRDLTAFANAPFAYSEALSQSGWAAPQNHAAGLGFTFANTIPTGAHVNSTRAVAEGRADIACIDALSWQLILRHDPHAAALREIGRTIPTPSLPFITGRGQYASAIAAALGAAIAALPPTARDAIGLHGLVQIADADYLAVANPAPPQSVPSRA